MMTCAEAKVASGVTRGRIAQQKRDTVAKERHNARIAVADIVKDKIAVLEEAVLKAIAQGAYAIEVTVDQPGDTSNLGWDITKEEVVAHFSDLGYNAGYVRSEGAITRGTFSVRWD